jgi:hypothetical protein
VRPGGTTPSAAFWRLVDRLQLPDAEALELISYPEKIGLSGKRPRFRLSTRQTHLASYLPVIEAALQAIGEAPGWLVRRNRSVPFRGGARRSSWWPSGTGKGPGRPERMSCAIKGVATIEARAKGTGTVVTIDFPDPDN